MVKQVKFNKKNLFLFFYVREVMVIVKTLLKKRNSINNPAHRFLKTDYKEILFDKYLLWELVIHFAKYFKERKSGLAFIKKIYNKQPLSSN
jgi:hypothetical protein